MSGISPKLNMASSIDNNISHVQAIFVTKQTQYSVPDTPFSVPINVTSDELTALINRLLHPDTGDAETAKTKFNFLINGEFLQTSLETHLQENEISQESVLEIEYLEHHAAPSPETALMHDDWVSTIRANQQLILSGCYDNTLRLWSIDGRSLMTIPGHTAPVKCVAWIKNDPESKKYMFVSGSHDQRLLLWQWNGERNEVDCIHVCKGHAGSVDCVAVDPTLARFCSGSWDRMLKVWSANIESESRDEEEDTEDKPVKRKKMNEAKIPTRVPVVTLSGHGEGISSVLWSGVNEICTASWDHTIRFWDMETATQKSSIQGNKVFLGVSHSPLSGVLVAASADRHIRLYDPRSTDGAIVKCTFTSHTGWVSSVAWSQTNEHHFLSGSYDNVMKLWDTRSPKVPLFNMTGHHDKILAVDWSVPQYLISAGADNYMKIFRYEDALKEN